VAAGGAGGGGGVATGVATGVAAGGGVWSLVTARGLYSMGMGR